jgi:hypothetical protein
LRGLQYCRIGHTLGAEPSAWHHDTSIGFAWGTHQTTLSALILLTAYLSEEARCPLVIPRQYGGCCAWLTSPASIVGKTSRTQYSPVWRGTSLACQVQTPRVEAAAYLLRTVL